MSPGRTSRRMPLTSRTMGFRGIGRSRRPGSCGGHRCHLGAGIHAERLRSPDPVVVSDQEVQFGPEYEISGRPNLLAQERYFQTRHGSRLPDLDRQEFFLAHTLNQLADLGEPVCEQLHALRCEPISDVMAPVVILQGQGVHLPLSVL